MAKKSSKETRGAQPKRQPAIDPRHPPGVPEPPSFVTDRALTEWHRVVPILQGLGKLTELDRAVLASYCVAWDQYHQAQDLVGGLDTMMVESSRGLPTLHPAVQARDKALAQMLECSKRIGLSAYDRERMKPPVEQSERDAEMSVLEYGRLLNRD